MGMVANPFVLAAVKVIAYSAFGHQVEKRSEVRRNAWIFGAMRVFVGWMVGIPLFFLLPHEGESAGYIYYAILTVPRFLSWALLIYVWYRPTGGLRLTLLWATAGTALSAAIDVTFLALAYRIPFFQMGWC